MSGFFALILLSSKLCNYGTRYDIKAIFFISYTLSYGKKIRFIGTLSYELPTMPMAEMIDQTVCLCFLPKSVLNSFDCPENKSLTHQYYVETPGVPKELTSL